MVKLVPPTAAYRDAGKTGKFHFARRNLDPTKEWFIPGTSADGSFITRCNHIIWHPEGREVSMLAIGDICGKCLGALTEQTGQSIEERLQQENAGLKAELESTRERLKHLEDREREQKKADGSRDRSMFE
jgi:hypothetical protein